MMYLDSRDKGVSWLIGIVDKINYTDSFDFVEYLYSLCQYSSSFRGMDCYISEHVLEQLCVVDDIASRWISALCIVVYA